MARATEWRTGRGSGLIFAPNFLLTLSIASLFPGETLTRTVWWWKYWSPSGGWNESFYFAHGAAALAAVPLSSFPPGIGPLTNPDAPWIWNELFIVDPQNAVTNQSAAPTFGEFKVDTDVNHRNDSGEDEVLGIFVEVPSSWEDSTIQDRVTFAARFLIMAAAPAIQPVTSSKSRWTPWLKNV